MIIIQREDSHLPGKLDFNMISAEQTGRVILHAQVGGIARKWI
jgi:hypothetical protein